jgi:DNA topoisomerase-1
MNPAIFAVTNIEITADKGIFKAQGKILKFDGYRKIYVQSSKQEDVILPSMKEADPLNLLKLKPSQHFTEPPARFNEASLVKTLEKEGIGRPSTYASIIGKIQDRNYVEVKERRFYATEIGMKVTDILVAHFPKVMDLTFTRSMEEELDQIETKKYNRNQVLEDFYGPFSIDLKKAETEMLANAEKCPLCGRPLEERFSKFGKFFGCSGYKEEPKCTYIKKKTVEGQAPGEAPAPTGINCPNCGKEMVKRAGKAGEFLGCSGYPECKTTMTYNEEGQAVLTSQTTEYTCEKCAAPMVKRMGKRGPFLGCSAYPKCKNIVEMDAEGKPVKPIDTGITWEKCGSPMAVKKSFRGPFLGCTAYPSCRSTKQLPPELKEKLKAEGAAAPAAKKAVAIDAPADIRCPECDGPMKLRPGRWGKFFFGCNKYPKCKGTLKASQEQVDQLQSAVAPAS